MDELPLSFYHLGLSNADYFMSDDHSFRGPCIQCGGSRRMVTFINGQFPQWWMRCDLCGLQGWVWQFFDVSNVIDGEADIPSIEGQIDNLNRTTERAANFLLNRDWETYHAQLDESGRQWWRESGVSDEWQDFWQLGYKPEHTFMQRGELYQRPAYTIPKFDLGFEPVNIDFRLVDPPLGVGKYRPFYGLPSRSFIARPDLPNLTTDGRLVIVEGAKKAMVLASQLGVQVVGIPGCKSWLDLMPLVSAHNPRQIVVVLDPDAIKTSWALAHALGPKAVQLSLPSKPDDAFLNGWLDETKFWKLVRTSGRRV